LEAVRSGEIDSVQVIYNIFDQNPVDELFPACHRLNVAIIARVPFDEGTLTGTLTRESKWPEGDWRNNYFSPENLIPSVERAEKLKALLADWNREHSTNITLPELALRFILSNDDVSTIIPGMRKLNHVESNIAASDEGPLPEELLKRLREFRWVRKPAPWSD
jgi:aryl-alcohol dehydrogenase-like predicted oxidoreductase